MTGYQPGRGGGPVRLAGTSLPGAALTRAGPSATIGSRRMTAWIVRSIMLATTAFAILDLSLLVASLHH